MIAFLVLFATFWSVVFVVCLLTVRWWEYPPGVSTFVTSFSLAVLLVLTSVRVFGLTPPMWLRFAAFILFCVALPGQVIGFFIVQRRGRLSRLHRVASSDERESVS